jgi:hypothetical protein
LPNALNCLTDLKGAQGSPVDQNPTNTVKDFLSKKKQNTRVFLTKNFNYHLVIKFEIF